MAVSTVAAIITAGALAAGSTIYSAEQQKKAAKADADRRAAEAASSKAEADRIASETKPEEEGLIETRFGTGEEDAVGGSTQEFLIPKTSALGAGGRSGLGFNI